MLRLVVESTAKNRNIYIPPNQRTTASMTYDRAVNAIIWCVLFIIHVTQSDDIPYFVLFKRQQFLEIVRPARQLVLHFAMPIFCLNNPYQLAILLEQITPVLC